MTQIEAVHAEPGVASFFFDDQQAIANGAVPDGFAYDGDPETSGYGRIREPGEALLVDIELSNGRVVRGDCAAVQYSGVGNRDPLFRANEYVSVVEETIAETLIGREAEAFADNETALKACTEDLHTAIEYGVSGALLQAAAETRNQQMFEVLADELGTEPATEPVDVFGQTGDARRRRADKMIIKGVDVLPHGLFNSIEKVGQDGQTLVTYLEWLADRVDVLGADGYQPRFHVDIYGMIDQIFGPPYDRPEVIEYFRRLSEAAAPYQLQVEEPVIAESRRSQIGILTELREGLKAADVPVDIVADEWCDDLEDIKAFVDAQAADLVQVKTPDLGSVANSGRAVRYCQNTDIDAYLGGTCNETDQTARVSAHIALGTDARQVLAKPGMGFDEGYMIITNEMRRALAARNRSAIPNR